MTASRFPFPASRRARYGIIALLLLAWPVPPSALAQVPIPNLPRPQQDTSRPDTVKVPQFRYPPPVPPLGAMWRSLLLPGWGQAVLHRRVTGAVFVFWEGLSLTMTLKASDQLRYLRQTGSDSSAVKLKKQEVQDWAVVLAFNHLMAGAEAFVSAELWDFPAELEARALPSARIGVGPAIYWGR